MSKELVSINDMMALAKQANEQVDTTELANVSKAAEYFDYIQLQNSAGSIPGGHYILNSGKEKIDLGDNFRCLIMSVRPKAMMFQPDIVVAYDAGSSLYQKLKALGDQKDSGCGYGPELLLYLPDHEQAATYFLANPTGRNASSTPVNGFHKSRFFYDVSSKQVQNTKAGKTYRWFAPVFEENEHGFEMNVDQEWFVQTVTRYMEQSNSATDLPEQASTSTRD